MEFFYNKSIHVLETGLFETGIKVGKLLSGIGSRNGECGVVVFRKTSFDEVVQDLVEGNHKYHRSLRSNLPQLA